MATYVDVFRLSLSVPFKIKSYVPASDELVVAIVMRLLTVVDKSAHDGFAGVPPAIRAVVIA
jgi:hypothetical protein